MIKNNMTIFFVSDQEIASRFYQTVLNMGPILEVPGMTEFQLSPESGLGLMPIAGAKNLLGEQHFPEQKSQRLRSELYLTVDEPQLYMNRALQAGAQLLQEPREQDWGDLTGYCQDLDGHVLAFARPI